MNPILKVMLVLAVLVLSSWFYATERSMEHFLWHVGYGSAAGMALGAWLMPRKSPVAAGLIGYAFMVMPDLIWASGKWLGDGPVAHQAWMDVFLFHVSLDAWPLATALVLPAYGLAILLYAWRAGTLMKPARVARV